MIRNNWHFILNYMMLYPKATSGEIRKHLCKWRNKPFVKKRYLYNENTKKFGYSEKEYDSGFYTWYFTKNDGYGCPKGRDAEYYTQNADGDWEITAKGHEKMMRYEQGFYR